MSLISIELALERHQERRTESEQGRRAGRVAAAARLQRRAARLAHRAERTAAHAERVAARARVAVARVI